MTWKRFPRRKRFHVGEEGGGHPPAPALNFCRRGFQNYPRRGNVFAVVKRFHVKRFHVKASSTWKRCVPGDTFPRRTFPRQKRFHVDNVSTLKRFHVGNVSTLEAFPRWRRSASTWKRFGHGKRARIFPPRKRLAADEVGRGNVFPVQNVSTSKTFPRRRLHTPGDDSGHGRADVETC